MGVEKVGTKGSGFFHLFDWNRKSRKKLFANGTVSPESVKQEKRSDSDDNLRTSGLRLNDEDEVVGVSSALGSSEYSCASSVTDEEGNGIRAPGVVARLMGLDSLPTSGVSEPYSTPLFDPRSIRDNRSQNRSPEICINDQFNHVLNRGGGYSRKPMESRSQKMPSSPIERFQIETLPPRTAKCLQITHHKLLSPIKNPGFISAKNAAHIMEAAAKILDPGLQASSKGKFTSLGSSSFSLKVRNPKESSAASQRTSRLLESSRRPVESTDVRYLRGQPLNKSWDGSEDITILRSSPDCDETNSADGKGKGKSISLAIQAKVNVQRREGSCTTSRNKLVQDQGECKLNQQFKSQPITQKNNQQKKSSTTNASSVLRQNNQKQNCPMSKDRQASKPSTSNHQGRKVVSGDASCAKNKTVNKLSGNARVGYRKEALEATEREGSSSSNNNFPRKKRFTEGGFHSENSGYVDNMLVGRHKKCVQPNVVIDENSRWTEDNRRNSTDVVSFTFNSPMIKPMPGSQSSTRAVERWDKRNGYCSDTKSDYDGSDVNNKKPSSHGLNVIGGDALGILLEQKLRELTSRVEPSYSNLAKAGTVAASAPVLEESVSTFSAHGTTTPAKHENEFLLRHRNNNLRGIFDSGLSSTDGEVIGMSHKLRGVEEVECSSTNDAQKEPDHQNPSPLSILEASFSNESCNSSESWDSTNGSKKYSSVRPQSIVGLNCINKSQSVEAEMELSDSASSTFAETADGDHVPGISGPDHSKTCETELECVREMISNTESMFNELGSYHVDEALDPLLFDRLENKAVETTSEGEEKGRRGRRKVLFDCVSECLEVKNSRYFRAGYQSWAKGVAVVGKDLAEELYKEISGWKSMGDWMVDELVDKDMSSHLGRWVDFEIEAFETGAEIERGILSSLVDEVVADFSIQG